MSTDQLSLFAARRAGDSAMYTVAANAGPDFTAKQIKCGWGRKNRFGKYLCNSFAVMKCSKTYMCPKHHRFTKMREHAASYGKVVPSYELLEELLSEVQSMTCPLCFRNMNWSATHSLSTAITLQHDRSGEMRLICFGCNSRHSALEGDRFYTLRSDHWICTRCKEEKHLSEFPKNGFGRKRQPLRKSMCRPCWLQRKREYRLMERSKVA